MVVLCDWVLVIQDITTHYFRLFLCFLTSYLFNFPNYELNLRDHLHFIQPVGKNETSGFLFILGFCLLHPYL